MSSLFDESAPDAGQDRASVVEQDCLFEITAQKCPVCSKRLGTCKCKQKGWSAPSLFEQGEQ